MGRFVSSAIGATAPTTARPCLSVFAIAGVGCGLREAAVFNTTTTAERLRLARMTNATGVGTGQTEGKYDDDTASADCTAFITHTADGGVGDGLHVMPCGAAIGSGVILTFYDQSIEVPPGTANGVGILCLTGTGQVSDAHLVWDE